MQIKSYTERSRGLSRIRTVDSLLRLGQVIELKTETFDDRGRRTTERAKYTLVGVYPYHAVFRRQLRNGHTLTYSFTKAELTHMILGGAT